MEGSALEPRPCDACFVSFVLQNTAIVPTKEMQDGKTGTGPTGLAGNWMERPAQLLTASPLWLNLPHL